jgi:plastocyanin
VPAERAPAASRVAARMAHPPRKGEIMTSSQAGRVAALTLALVAACGKDPVSIAGQDASALSANGPATASRSGNDDDDHGAAKIAMRDDCDPTDPAWAPTGGCLLRRGNVTNAEFNRELTSPLIVSTVGHMAWRNDPTYLVLQAGRTVRVRNEGGRAHTFTEVAQFGGGKVPPLNRGMTVAPECPASVNIAPGASVEVTGLAVGDHHFQCCIHPWMREMIKVKAPAEDGDR